MGENFNLGDLEMITRKYKLAVNFNTVELEFDRDELLSLAEEDELDFFDESSEVEVLVTEEELISRLLNREYKILAGIETTSVTEKEINPEDRPSDKQILWAKNLGMKHPEKATKAEVYQFIQKNKK